MLVRLQGELLCIYTALPDVEKSQIFNLDLPNSLNFSFNYKIALMVMMVSYIPSKWVIIVYNKSRLL